METKGMTEEEFKAHKANLSDNKKHPPSPKPISQPNLSAHRKKKNSFDEIS